MNGTSRSNPTMATPCERRNRNKGASTCAFSVLYSVHVCTLSGSLAGCEVKEELRSQPAISRQRQRGLHRLSFPPVSQASNLTPWKVSFLDKVERLQRTTFPPGPPRSPFLLRR